MDWTKTEIVPRTNLQAWHQYEPGISSHNYIVDYSGYARTVSCAVSNSPALNPNILNGQPGWYFNGSRDPLKCAGDVTLRHLFVVISADDGAFNALRGIVGGFVNAHILVGNSGTDLFYDFSTDFSSEYRKADTVYAANNQKAPMFGNAAVVEVKIPAGKILDGIQYGQQENLTARKWKGYLFESLIYSEVLNDCQRKNLYQYFAMRYHLWQQSGGLNVFPFPANKSRVSERNRETYLSEPYGGNPKALIRGGFNRAIQLPFESRRQEEFEAAEAFHAAHHPLTEFVFRDGNFYPYKERIVRMNSSFRDGGGNVTNRFNYGFEVIEDN